MGEGFLQAVGDGRGHGRVEGIVPEHRFDAGELEGLRLLQLADALFLLGLKSNLTFHKSASSGFSEQDGETLAGAVQFATDSVWGLVGERADLLVA